MEGWSGKLASHTYPRSPILRLAASISCGVLTLWLCQPQILTFWRTPGGLPVRVPISKRYWRWAGARWLKRSSNPGALEHLLFHISAASAKSAPNQLGLTGEN